MSRSKILQRIKQKLNGKEVPDLPTEIPAFPVFANPVAQFRTQLESVGGVVLEGYSTEGVKTALLHILEETQAAEIFWESEEIFDKHGIPHLLRDAAAFDTGRLVYSSHFRGKVDLPLVLHARPYSRNLLASIQLSVSSASWAAAETGTIINEVQPGRGRVFPIVPPAHVVLVSEKSLLQNNRDLLEKAPDPDQSSAYTLVTGPSQTADIEKILVRGVHGPHKWFVVLTD